jgi:ubiquinone/menaquinone biosynthesis C-methylase UbiE
MNSHELGKNYNKNAEWWTAQMEGSDYGMKYVRKAMSLAKKNSKVLDIGCGSTGAFSGS